MAIDVYHKTWNRICHPGKKISTNLNGEILLLVVVGSNLDEVNSDGVNMIYNINVENICGDRFVYRISRGIPPGYK